MKRRIRIGLRRGVSLIEVVIAVAIMSIGTLATLSLLTFMRLHNDHEQERARAHQIVTEEMEIVRFNLYPRIRSNSATTVWDNGTPLDPADDTTGTIDVVVRDAYTGTQLFAAPVPSRLLKVEVTLEWNPRGRLNTKTYRETLVSYVSPT